MTVVRVFVGRIKAIGRVRLVWFIFNDEGRLAMFGGFGWFIG